MIIDMSEDVKSDDTAAATVPVTAPAEVVSSIRKYVAREGGSAKAVLQPVGGAGVRITLVGGDDGVLGDRMVDSLAVAKAVVAEVEGLETAEWDRDLTSRTEITPAHWRKMAGAAAHQHHFPRPRNYKDLD